MMEKITEELEDVFTYMDGMLVSRRNNEELKKRLLKLSDKLVRNGLKQNYENVEIKKLY